MKTVWEYIKVAISGIIVGIANIIPGVSGGTMMVAMNIYDRVIDALSNFRRDVKGNILFLVPFLLGAGAGILAFASLIEFLLADHPIPTNFFFIGLVLGSIPFIFRRSIKGKARVSPVIAFVLALAVMLAMTLLQPGESGQAVMTTLTFGNFFFLLICGAIAAAAMIIPGISGSFLMLVLGAYATITAALSGLTKFQNFGSNLLLLIPVGIGIVIGLLGGSKLISMALKRFTQASYAAILGLMIGSIFSIYPGISGGWTLAITALALAAGTALTLYFSPKGDQ